MDDTKITRNNFIKLLGLTSTVISTGNLAESLSEANNNAPNILIVLFDTLSAYHMSLYGYQRNTTPKINELSKKSTVFHNHYSGGNYTSPGTATLLTGTYPWTHRVFHLHGTTDNFFTNNNLFSEFSDKYNIFAYTQNPVVFTLLHQFQASINQIITPSQLYNLSNIYSEQFFLKDFPLAFRAELLAISNRFPIPSSLFLSKLEILKRKYQLNISQREFLDNFPYGLPIYSDGQYPTAFFTIEDVIDWLSTFVNNQKRPFLGYIHLLPPHWPYNTRREFLDKFKDGWKPIEKPKHFLRYGRYGYDQDFLNNSRRNYDEYIAYVDSEFARLYKTLENNGILKDTYLIFTSDHGEMFERGIYQHTTPTLYEPISRIPLVIFSPNQEKRQDIYSSTSNVDILPTLLNISNLPIPEWSEGSILPSFEDSDEPDNRNIFIIEAKQNPKTAPLQIATIAMIKDYHKLIKYMGYNYTDTTYELFNLEEDPEELENLLPNSSLSSELINEMEEKIKNMNDKLSYR
jgi:arylsulfatase A-like enzyme